MAASVALAVCLVGRCRRRSLRPQSVPRRRRACPRSARPGWRPSRAGTRRTPAGAARRRAAGEGARRPVRRPARRPSSPPEPGRRPRWRPAAIGQFPRARRRRPRCAALAGPGGTGRVGRKRLGSGLVADLGGISPSVSSVGAVMFLGGRVGQRRASLRARRSSRTRRGDRGTAATRGSASCHRWCGRWASSVAGRAP